MAESQDFILRAVLYELLAKSLSCPTVELAEAVSSGGYCTAARELCNALQIEEISTWKALIGQIDKAWADANTNDVLHGLRAEYTRLFIGTIHPIISPYGSYWKAISEGKEPVLFLSQETQDVEAAMHACGVGNKPGLKEPLDHIACELEFLQYAALVLAGAEPPRKGTVVQEREIEAFTDRHVRNWIPDFAAAIERESDNAFYRLAAYLLRLV